MAETASPMRQRADALGVDRLRRFYEQMVFIRMVEEKIAELYAEQEMRCPVHLSIGQEATAVGVCEALALKDKVFSTHRSHAHYLAKGGDLDAMIAEIYGKEAGCIGGRGGSMHLMDLPKGMVCSVPIVGSSIPLAVGSALASALDDDGAVSVAFIGDASVEEGVFHESANFASLRRLPVIFVCENNLYSVYTPLNRRQPDRKLTELAKGHGVFADAADGNDVAAVYELTRQAVARARDGGGPSFLLFETYRWREHCGPGFDNHLGYRTEAEYLEWRARCPVERLESRIRADGALAVDAEAEIRTRLEARIAASFDRARLAPLPSKDKAPHHVYA